MITKVTGILNRVLDEEARVQIGGLEYQVLIPEFVRRQIQLQIGQEITLYTTEFFEGNPMQGRVVPRLVGFLMEAELAFFELFCTVDKVGIRKALKALTRPIRDVANAIQREDVKWLTSLPGIGAATGEQIITSLKRKVTKYAFSTPSYEEKGHESAGDGKLQVVDGNLVEVAYSALLALGHSPMEARERLDGVLRRDVAFTSVEEIILAIYKRGG